MCSILNRVRNTVVINEPNEVFRLMHNSSTTPMPQFYDAVRERIRNNLPIKNKMLNGKFIEDTNVTDIRSDYIPNVNPDKLILGTKNTLVYLCTLERLKKQFKDVTIVACVRHPIDAIASWANISFPHIRNLDMNFLLDYSDECGAKSIKRIMNKSNLSQRYAMWWDYLAKTIHKNSHHLVIVRYEDMVSNPLKTINEICGAASFEATMLEDIKPSSPRSHRAELSTETIDLINTYCTNSASKLGYQL